MHGVRQVVRSLFVAIQASKCQAHSSAFKDHCLAVSSQPASVVRTLSTSSQHLARGSRTRSVADDDTSDPYSPSYPSNPEMQPFALPYDADLEDLVPPNAHQGQTVRIQSQPDYREHLHEPLDMEIPQRPSKMRPTERAKRMRPDVDPKLTSIVLFPGQGSQFVGMGRKLLEYPNVAEIYAAANHILGYDLLKLCLQGPEKELARTVNCQAAVFVTEIAALEKLKEDYPMAVETCVATSGFSVGELAALVFAGSVTFENALKVVKARAEAMQAASELVHGGMMTVQITHKSILGQAMEVAKKWCKEKKKINKPICGVANYLHPDLKVLAGNAEALDFIEANQKLFDITVVKRLNVSGAFHTRLMEPARDEVYNTLRDAELVPPKIKVFSNVTTLPYTDVKSIVKLLLNQMVSPVRWEQIMHNLYDFGQGQEFPQTYEVGPGRQLGALLRKVNAKAFNSYTAIEV
ncbi:probable malonyl-CoA-acyl carrier protein transacylase, mitochondrial [Paramacrobiotus metropolitanus]|uniref:probable malonyl-CoA-acyl carrier protein transacylase, mitochondrial n=1 Tax=Paramacrobiotus metropolitanus TaxID=2943436 RepID=UPI002445B188|nr:probable malonyl-CoA-acyl carrier protein transacylase, mitochondrial [Paramacrobiotus metropolitanus]